MAKDRARIGPMPSSGASRRTRKERTAETAREEQAYEPGEWVYYHSSRIRRARYDPVNYMLEVEWMKPGLPYLYLGVEPNVWRNMNRVVSVGKFVNRVLNNYNYAPRID